MFSLLLPPRPLQLPQTLSPTQYTFTIPLSPPFTHIVIFQHPSSPLPPQTAAAIYLQLPSPSGEFRFLGAIADEKPSAIFRVAAAAAAATTTTPELGDEGGSDAVVEILPPLEIAESRIGGEMMVVGVAIEPVADVAGKMAALEAERASQRTQPNGGSSSLINNNNSTSTEVMVRRPLATKELAQKIIGNAFNYLASFTQGTGSNEMVPLKSFREWWAKFEKKVELDPGFLERGDG